MWHAENAEQTVNANEIVDRDRFLRQRGAVLRQIGRRAIDARIVLATSGLGTAESVLWHPGADGRWVTVPTAAIPTYKQDKNYYMGDIVRLNIKALLGRVVIIGDEGSNRGQLLVDVASSIKPPTETDKGRLYGKEALTYAFIANKHGIKPDFVGEWCDGEPPKPYWEFEELRRIPEVRRIAHEVELQDKSQRPSALVVVGDCLMAGAELAKRLDISGRYVGGLPVDENGVPDMSWAHIGDCEDRRVLVLGAVDAQLDSVIDAVSKTGKPQSYALAA